jgi:hypothetical protein
LEPTRWAVEIWHLACAPKVICDISNDVVAHLRIAHLGGHMMGELINRGTLPVKHLGADPKRAAMMVAKRCRTCKVSKSSKPAVMHNPRARKDAPFDVAFADVAGPFSTGVTGDNYIFAIRDSCTRWMTVASMTARRNVHEALKDVLQKLKFAQRFVRTTSGAAKNPIITTLQVDSARELVGVDSRFSKACAERGITMRQTAAYLHNQNGVIERAWRTICDGARSMLMEARLDADWWPHAIEHMCYIMNRVPCDGGPSPYERLTGKPPDLQRLRIFGSNAAMHLDYQQRSQSTETPLVDSGGHPRKLADRARMLIYVGNDENSTCYKLVSRTSPKAVVHSDMVRIDETSITDARDNQLESHRFHFDVAKPEGVMLDKRTDAFTVLDHRMMRTTDDDWTPEQNHTAGDEVTAIIKVSTKEHPAGIWSEPCHLFNSNPSGYDTIIKYLTERHHVENNPYFPLFSIATYTHEEHMIPARPDNVDTNTRYTQCIVIGLDLDCQDSDNTRIAIRNDDGIEHTLIDVPRESITVVTPSGNTALAFVPDTYYAFTAEITRQPTFSDDLIQQQTVTQPRSMKAALRAPDAVLWKEAAQKEFTTLVKKGTFEFIDEVPPGATAIMCVFKLTVKWNKDGTLNKRKARLVVFGMLQTYGVDYKETFAPSSQVTSVHLLLCMAVQWNLWVYQADVVSAFVNADLEETVYVSLPPECSRKPALLKKSLYGLKQGAHAWHKASDALMMSIPNMQKSQVETCWYYIKHGDLIVHVLVHIDDYIIATNQPQWKEYFIDYYNQHYEINDLGKLDMVVGIPVEWGDDNVTLCRKHQIEQTMRNANLGTANPQKYPIDPGAKLKMPEECVTALPFRNIMGEVLFHSRTGRFDVATALAILGRFSAKHAHEHFDALKGVVRYLKGTIDLPHILSKGIGGANGALRLSMHADASYASCPDTFRSISGWAIFLNGNAILAVSKRQERIAQSSTEAEIIALSEGCKDLMYLYQLLSEFHHVELPMKCHEDNTAAIDVLNDPFNNKKTRCVLTRYMKTRELIADGLIMLAHISTDLNVADFLTKPLTGQKFLEKRAYLMGHQHPPV